MSDIKPFKINADLLDTQTSVGVWEVDAEMGCWELLEAVACVLEHIWFCLKSKSQKK